MARNSLRCRRGLSTAVGTAFFIIVVIISMSAIWALSSFQSRYQGVTQQMNDWDTQRISENLVVRYVNNNASAPYNFSITLDNTGGVPVTISRIYVLNQTGNMLRAYDPLNKSAPKPARFVGFNSTQNTINTGEVAHVIPVNGTKLNDAYLYRIILTTERGRQFGYSYPPIGAGGAGALGYALVISDDHDNFQYAAGSNPTFYSAYVKPAMTDTTLYRLLLNNTTSRRIQFVANTSMLQMAGKVGQVIERYLISNTTTLPRANPIVFSSQIIEPHSSQYLYFGATTPGGTTWQDEPGKTYWLVAWMLRFKYVGESEVRSIGTPSVAQLLT